MSITAEYNDNALTSLRKTMLKNNSGDGSSPHAFPRTSSASLRASMTRGLSTIQIGGNSSTASTRSIRGGNPDVRTSMFTRKVGSETITMPIELLSSIVSLLQDNSSESSIKAALNFICGACASELQCEKVDLMILSKGSATMVPVTQVVNIASPLGIAIAEQLGAETGDVSFEDNYQDLVDGFFEGESITVDPGSIWDQTLSTGEVVKSSEEEIPETLLGENYMRIINDAFPANFTVNSLMAVPIRCTRSSEHLVGLILCQNKMNGENFTEDDVAVPEQLSHFSGIAISSLEMMVEADAKQIKLQHLLNTISSLASDENVGSQMRRLHKDTMKLIGSDDLTLYILNHGTNQLIAAHSSFRTGGKVNVDDKSIPGIVAITGGE